MEDQAPAAPHTPTIFVECIIYRVEGRGVRRYYCVERWLDDLIAPGRWSVPGGCVTDKDYALAYRAGEQYDPLKAVCDQVLAKTGEVKLDLKSRRALCSYVTTQSNGALALVIPYLVRQFSDRTAVGPKRAGRGEWLLLEELEQRKCDHRLVEALKKFDAPID